MVGSRWGIGLERQLYLSPELGGLWFKSRCRRFPIILSWFYLSQLSLISNEMEDEKEMQSNRRWTFCNWKRAFKSFVGCKTGFSCRTTLVKCWNDGTCTLQGAGPTAGDLVPGSRRVRKKKKKKGLLLFEILLMLIEPKNYMKEEYCRNGRGWHLTFGWAFRQLTDKQVLNVIMLVSLLKKCTNGLTDTNSKVLSFTLQVFQMYNALYTVYALTRVVVKNGFTLGGVYTSQFFVSHVQLQSFI